MLQKNSSANPKGLKLIIDVCTRWNSTYTMIERYLEIHPAVYAALAELKVNNRKFHSRDYWQHWQPVTCLQVLHTL